MLRSFKAGLYFVCFLTVFLLSMGHASAQVKHKKFVIIAPDHSKTFPVANTIATLLGKKILPCHQNEPPVQRIGELIHEAKVTNSILHMHVKPTPELVKLLKNRNCKVIFLVRDPRDYAVCLLQGLHERNLKGLEEHRTAFMQLNHNQQLNAVILGKEYGLPGVRQALGKYMQWMKFNSNFVLTVRYEDIVAAKDGGFDRNKQLETVMALINHIEADVPKAEISIELLRLLNNKHSDVGVWHQEFNKKNVKAFKEAFGKQLIKWGYETDENWQSDLSRFQKVRGKGR